tara:strand:- start:378 stop:1412 length:1035 start_codon:yes stop_codon:yes gene_type:complete
MDNKRLKQITNQILKSFNNWDIKKAISFSSDETQTRDFLIEPFFEILGYNKMDDYLHEYIADMGTKRGRRVDMAISFGQNKPIILVECKKATINLTDNHFRQLNEYSLYTESAKLGILTNGISYDFYSRSSENNVILNETPFFSFDITNYTDSDIETLALFYRPTFDINIILDEADDIYFLERFDEALFDTLSNPSDDLIRIINKKMGGKRLTENISNQIFNLINSNSLKSVIDRITQKEIQESNTGIITTNEELRVYNIIKTILAMSSKIKDTELERISFKDFKGSFAIIVDGSSRKKICALRIHKGLIEIGDNTFELKGTKSTSLTEFKKELVASALKYLND